MPKIRTVLLILLTLAGVGALFQYLQPRPINPVRASLVYSLPPAVDSSQFRAATAPIPLPFPETFGAHEDFQTEWWYYTGNLRTLNGERFGYQLTFFRRSLIPQIQGVRQSETSMRTTQAYMAHFAITDGSRAQHYQAERFQRGAGGVAGVETNPYQVWLDDWSVEEVGPGIYKLKAEELTLDNHQIAVNFTLTDLKAPILHGIEGLSQKGSEVGNASYYYSQTRLETYGEIKIDSRIHTVTGFSWKDHEFGTTALGEEIVGWDWYAFQFDDNTELMLYNLRNRDGANASTSTGTWVTADGESRPIAWEDVEVTVSENWSSPHTEGVYPSQWQIRIPSEGIDITVVPLVSDQEMLNSTVYWEGAVQITGSHKGFGYIELTGYGGPLPLL